MKIDPVTEKTISTSNNHENNDKPIIKGIADLVSNSIKSEMIELKPVGKSQDIQKLKEEKHRIFVNNFLDSLKKLAEDDSKGYVSGGGLPGISEGYDCGTYVTQALINIGALPDDALDKYLHIQAAGDDHVYNYDLVVNDYNFEELPYTGMDDLEAGDIVYSNEHVIVYIGDGKTAQATRNKDGMPGDSGSNEIVYGQPFNEYDHNWTYVYRHIETVTPYEFKQTVHEQTK